MSSRGDILHNVDEGSNLGSSHALFLVISSLHIQLPLRFARKEEGSRIGSQHLFDCVGISVEESPVFSSSREKTISHSSSSSSCHTNLKYFGVEELLQLLTSLNPYEAEFVWRNYFGQSKVAGHCTHWN